MRGAVAETSRDNSGSRSAGCLALLLVVAAVAFTVPFMGAAWGVDAVRVTAYLFGAWVVCIVLTVCLLARKPAAHGADAGSAAPRREP